MTTTLHGDPFGNPWPDHIPYGRPPEIVWDLSGRSCLSTSPLPGFVVPDDTLTVSMKYIRASGIISLMLLPLVDQYSTEFLGQENQPSAFVPDGRATTGVSRTSFHRSGTHGV